MAIPQNLIDFKILRSEVINLIFTIEQKIINRTMLEPGEFIAAIDKILKEKFLVAKDNEKIDDNLLAKITPKFFCEQLKDKSLSLSEDIFELFLLIKNMRLKVSQALQKNSPYNGEKDKKGNVNTVSVSTDLLSKNMGHGTLEKVLSFLYLIDFPSLENTSKKFKTHLTIEFSKLKIKLQCNILFILDRKPSQEYLFLDEKDVSVVTESALKKASASRENIDLVKLSIQCLARFSARALQKYLADIKNSIFCTVINHPETKTTVTRRLPPDGFYDLEKTEPAWTEIRNSYNYEVAKNIFLPQFVPHVSVKDEKDTNVTHQPQYIHLPLINLLQNPYVFIHFDDENSKTLILLRQIMLALRIQNAIEFNQEKNIRNILGKGILLNYEFKGFSVKQHILPIIFLKGYKRYIHLFLDAGMRFTNYDLSKLKQVFGDKFIFDETIEHILRQPTNSKNVMWHAETIMNFAKIEGFKQALLNKIKLLPIEKRLKVLAAACDPQQNNLLSKLFYVPRSQFEVNPKRGILAQVFANLTQVKSDLSKLVRGSTPPSDPSVTVRINLNGAGIKTSTVDNKLDVIPRTLHNFKMN